MKFNKTATVGAAALACVLAMPAMAYQDAEAQETTEAATEEAAEAVMETATEAAEAPMQAEAPAKPVNVAPEGSPHFIPAPPPGKGQIVFYRSSAMGFAVGCTVNQGDKDSKVKVSSVGSGKYVIVTADPGKQEYWTKSEAKDALTVLVEEGETQYVECRIKMGFMVGRPDLSPSDAAEFVEKGAKLKMVDDDDMGEGALRSTDLAAMQ